MILLNNLVILFLLISLVVQIEGHRYNRWKRARQCYCNDCDKEDIEKLDEPLHWAKVFYICKKCECSDTNTLIT